MIKLVDLKAEYEEIKEEVNKAITEVIESSRFLNGEKTKSFSAGFAAYCGAKHAVGTSSGTSAISLALNASGIGPGDDVITTPFTFIATVEAIYDAGATPVFVDADKETANIDPKLVERAITKNTKAILPVHLYGRISGMDELMEIAEKHNLSLIEDSAQAHGSDYNGKKSPVLETASYSFYPGKTLGAYGDAGAIVTNNSDVFEKASMLLDHGRRQGEKYTHRELGHNFRMDEIQAAVLGVKLRRLDSWIERRRRHALHYNKVLRADIGKPSEKAIRSQGMYVYVITAKNRDALVAKLKENNVEAVVHYPVPLHLQPALAELGYKKGDLPEAERLASEVLSLPLYPQISEGQIGRVAELVNKHANG